METRPAGAVEVDVCSTCRGLWIDALDGDLAVVAHDAAPLSGAPGARRHPSRCPCCGEALAFHVVEGVRAFLYRCVACNGTFVPRDAFDDLAALGEVRAPRASVLGRILAILRGLRG